jgi:hypothetical protein
MYKNKSKINFNIFLKTIKYASSFYKSVFRNITAIQSIFFYKYIKVIFFYFKKLFLILTH